MRHQESSFLSSRDDSKSSIFRWSLNSLRINSGCGFLPKMTAGRFPDFCWGWKFLSMMIAERCLVLSSSSNLLSIWTAEGFLVFLWDGSGKMWAVGRCRGCKQGGVVSRSSFFDDAWKLRLEFYMGQKGLPWLIFLQPQVPLNQYVSQTQNTSALIRTFSYCIYEKKTLPCL